MNKKILRACTAIAASSCVILIARSQTATAPTTVQPVVPPQTMTAPATPTPLLGTTPAATAPAPYSFSLQGANWSLPSSGAFPALSMTSELFTRPTSRPALCVSIVRHPDAASNDLKALMNNRWLFTLTATVYGASGNAVLTYIFRNSRVKSVIPVFDAQRQIQEQLDFTCETFAVVHNK